jgi:mercuric ion transport protein
MKLGFVDKIGSIGSLVTAAACPACFPMLAVVGSAVGLGVLRPLEGKVFLAFQLLVGVSLVGSFISYFNHRKILPLLIGVISPGLIFFALYIRFHSVIIYSGLLGLAVASVMNLLANRHCRKCNLEAKPDEA